MNTLYEFYQVILDAKGTKNNDFPQWARMVKQLSSYFKDIQEFKSFLKIRTRSYRERNFHRWWIHHLIKDAIDHKAKQMKQEEQIIPKFLEELLCKQKNTMRKVAS